MQLEPDKPVAANDFVLNQPPRRVVSLVPSLTESLFDMGLGQALVGVTDYCIYPAEPLKGLAWVGGPKNPRILDILALNPDLVLANQEENTPQVVRALDQAGVQVWVSFPKTVREAMQVLHSLAGVFMSQPAALRLDTLDRAVEMLELSRNDQASIRYFCPIWRSATGKGQDWWMTFNKHTYTSDLLYWLGGENVFAQRARRYPLEADLGNTQAEEQEKRDTRYPRVSADEIRAANPDLIFLPSEPFQFTEEHRREVMDLLHEVEAVRKGKVHLVDGSLVTWHGTRLAKAISQLRPLMDC